MSCDVVAAEPVQSARLQPQISNVIADNILLQKHARQATFAGILLDDPHLGKGKSSVHGSSSEWDWNLFWERWGLAVYIGIGALVLAAVVGLVCVVRKYREQPAKETPVTSASQEPSLQSRLESSSQSGKETETPVSDKSQSSIGPPQRQSKAATTAAVANDGKSDLVALGDLAQRVYAAVMPKIAKAVGVRDVLSKRLALARHRTEHMLLKEVEGMSAEVCEVIDAPEVMLLKDWNMAATHFPPLPGLVSGLFAPLRLQLSFVCHAIQIAGVLPILALLVWSLYADRNNECVPEPLLRPWVASTLSAGVLLVLCRIGLCIKLRSGLRKMEAKANEILERSEQRQSEFEAGIGGSELHDIKEFLVDHTVLASHALKVDGDMNASIFCHLIGITTIFWVGCIFWNLEAAVAWNFVPGKLAFHDAADHHEDFCGAWRLVFAGRLIAVMSVFLLVFNVLSILHWVLGFAMKYDAVAVRVHSATRSFDQMTTGLPVFQLFLRFFILPSAAEMEEVRIHHVRQKYLQSEEDLKKAEKDFNKMQLHRDKEANKLKKLEEENAANAASGKGAKNPLDQSLEEIEQGLRDTFNPTMWRSEGMAAVQKAKNHVPDDEEEGEQATSAENLSRLVGDLTQLAQRVQESQEFEEATEVMGAQGQQVLAQAQAAAEGLGVEEMSQEALRKAKGAEDAAKLAMTQAQQSETLQKARKQAQDAASAVIAEGSEASAAASKKLSSGQGDSKK